MNIKGKRVLKNGAIGGYVLQKNGKYVWRIIKGPSKQKGGNQKGKRVLKNGAIGGYVLQKNGKYVWRIIKGPSKQKGGDFNNMQTGNFYNIQTPFNMSGFFNPLKIIVSKYIDKYINKFGEENYFNYLSKYPKNSHLFSRDLYSSYQKQIDITQKDFLWCSKNITQSILHPLNNDRLTNKSEEYKVQPYMYKFDLKQPVRLLPSSSEKNTYIFNILFQYSRRENWEHEYNNFMSELCKYYGETNKDKLFKGENNYRILLILKEYNNLVPEKCKINGYHNINDQEEIAFIDFHNLINPDIIEYKFIKLKFKEDMIKKLKELYPTNNNLKNEIHFPVTYSEFKIIIKEYKPVGFIHQLNRIKCWHLESIEYQNTSNNIIETFNCPIYRY